VLYLAPCFFDKQAMQYIDKILKLVRTGYIKTKYSHANFIRRRYNQFIFNVDCSGLVEFWLSKRHPKALAEVYDFVYQNRQVPEEAIKRLYSFDFYDFFASLKSSSCWQTVTTSANLKRGDIIAFINPHKKGRFGHVAIVDKEISRDKQKIVVKIIDSSQIEHISDYRQSSKKGIGCGIIELYIEKSSITQVSYCLGQIKPRLIQIARLL